MDEALRQWTRAKTAAMGWTDTLTWDPLPVEASHRMFYRVAPGISKKGSDNTSLVVMLSPPDLENNDQFVILARVFAAGGVGVPRLFAQEPDAGWFLMSDLGSTHLADVYETHAQDRVLPSVIETLTRIQQITDPAIPAYTPQRFRDELEIFSRWFVENLLDRTFPQTRLEECFENLVANTQSQPQCCVHRDFHCRNLMLAANGDIGVVDFQDALMGPAAYDLASLLRDCYYRFAEADVARWRDAYLSRTTLPVDRGRFPEQLDLTAIQRQLKAVGIFARLHIRDHKSSHLVHIVPVLDQLQDLCRAYPHMHELAVFLGDIRSDTGRRLGELICAP